MCFRICMCMQGHLSGNNREQSRDVIRRWVFPNAVLSACWRGGIQMTCVQLWQTRSLGGNQCRCVCAGEWVCPRLPLCQSAVMIVFVYHKFIQNLFCALRIQSNAFLPSIPSLPARKYIFALVSSLFMQSVRERVSNKCQFTGWIALDFKACLDPFSYFIKWNLLTL